MKTSDWYVCIEENHQGMKEEWFRKSHVVITVVPKEYWDKNKSIPDSVSDAEYKFIDESIKQLGLWWQRGEKETFGNRNNTIGSMQFDSWANSSKKNPRGDMARYFIQLGFNYNRCLTEGLPPNKRGKVVEPGFIDTADCAHGICYRFAQDGVYEKTLNLLPEYVREGCVNRLLDKSLWKQQKKSKTERTFVFDYHPQLKAVVITDDYRVLSVNAFYEVDKAAENNSEKYKAENESDQKYIDFVRENLNNNPTRKDFEVVAAAVNLILTLPPGHAVTSVIKTLRGKATSTKKRAEFGIAKEYKGSHVERMAWNLHKWLEERNILKYKTPPPAKSGNYEDEAPDFIQFRDVSTMEAALLNEHYKELGEKYGK